MFANWSHGSVSRFGSQIPSLGLLFLLFCALVPAQGSAKLLTFNAPGGAELGSIDADGNLALTGALLERDTTMTLDAARAAWACRDAAGGGGLLALLPLEGAGAGALHIAGALRENDFPSPAHPFVLASPAGTVVASISPEGDLYLLGQLSQGEGGPRLLAVAAASSTELRLTWRAATGATGYRVEVSPDGAGNWSRLATSPDPLPSGTTSWTHGGLTPGTTRFYRVIAVGGGSGLPSNVLGGQTPAGEALETVDYAYDGWRALEERENGGEAPARQYVYGSYLDEPLQMTAGGVPYYYHQGLNYSVAGLTNGAGEVVEAYEYTPYGRHVTITDGDGDGRVNFDGSDTVVADAASPLGNPCLYTGQRFDAETGLYYYKNRYYDAQVGRFVSRDPIGISGGINLYNYVKSDPITKNDVYGLYEVTFKNCCCNSIWKDRTRNVVGGACSRASTIIREVSFIRGRIYMYKLNGDAIWDKYEEYLQQLQMEAQNIVLRCSKNITIKCKESIKNSDMFAYWMPILGTPLSIETQPCFDHKTCDYYHELWHQANMTEGINDKNPALFIYHPNSSYTAEHLCINPFGELHMIFENLLLEVGIKGQEFTDYMDLIDPILLIGIGMSQL